MFKPYDLARYKVPFGHYSRTVEIISSPYPADVGKVDLVEIRRVPGEPTTLAPGGCPVGALTAIPKERYLHVASHRWSFIMALGFLILGGFNDWH